MAKLPKLIDPSLRLVWVDLAEILVRQDIPIATITFYSSLHDRIAEACRIQTTTDHLKKIAGIICSITDYYPERPKNKSQGGDTRQVKRK
jgi:hypothetical protein